MSKIYQILKDGEIIESSVPGEYGGYNGRKADRLIFGRLNCTSGKRMKRENRVFFHNLEDAVEQGYRPCKKCKPLSEEDFERVKHLVPQYATLQDFYDRDKKK